MRKYQQLGLVLVSLISIGILIVYRSENERLNNVLSVINFFGQQKDTLNLVKIENYSNFTYKFHYPLPAWSNLGNDFYGYSAFWKKNDLKKGGEAISIVVASIHSTVSFQCKIQFTDNSLGSGKFTFMRIEQTEVSDNEIKNAELMGGNDNKFLIYKFLCKTQFDYGDPQNLIFINTQTKSEHYIPIRHLNVLKSRASIMDKSDKTVLTLCLDLNTYNRSFSDAFNNDTNIAQYFLHHELIGIRSFIVYNSHVNQVHQHIIDLLTNKFGVRLSILPYNFPFPLNNREKNRAIIEADCLLRTSGLTKYVAVTSLNEYLYPASKIFSQSSLMKLFSRTSNEVNRFEIASKTVCMDSRKRILSDNEKYSADIKTRPFFIEKNEFPYNNKEFNDMGKKPIEIETDLMVVHKYIKCPSTLDLYPWRTTLKDSHVEFINFISTELNKLLFVNP